MDNTHPAFLDFVDKRRAHNAASIVYRDTSTAEAEAKARLRDALIAEGGWTHGQLIKDKLGAEYRIGHFTFKVDTEKAYLVAWSHRRIKTGEWSQRPETPVALASIMLPEK